MTIYQWNDFIQSQYDIGMQGFIIGFFGCLMTVFPVAMLALIPHDGWRRGEYAAKDQARIKQLENELDLLNKELILHKQIVDQFIKDKMNA